MSSGSDPGAGMPSDLFYMQRALTLADQALGRTSPNPAVGAVLVRDGQVVGEGYTRAAGGPHAEAVALQQAGTAARGATLYVSLEPCCHHGRTPPCTQAIIEAGVAEVHLATLDPNPLVSGQGHRELEGAGLRVVVGEAEVQARRLNEAFFKYITTGRPFVIAKWAMSLDGKLATRTGDARWVSGEVARRRVHELRDTVDAIVVGVDTILADDPQLTARVPSHRTPRPSTRPLRVVVDSTCRLPTSARLLSPELAPGTLVATTERAPLHRRREVQGTGAEVMVLPERDGKVDLSALLALLARRELLCVLVEGGGRLLGSFLAQGLVDKVWTFVSPKLVGGNLFPGAGWPGAEAMSQALKLEQVRVEQVGEDVLIEGYLVEREHVHRDS